MIMILIRRILSPKRGQEEITLTSSEKSSRPTGHFRDTNSRAIDKSGNAPNRRGYHHSLPKCHFQSSTNPVVGCCWALTFILATSLLASSTEAALALGEKAGDSQPADEEPYHHRRYQHYRNQRQQHHLHYQPSLIGFRCEITRDVTSNGVSVIEANSPVTLTLYGESFSTNTIVAFTNEFRPDPKVGAGGWLDSPPEDADQDTSAATTGTSANVTFELGQAPTGRPLVSADTSGIDRAPKRKFAERRKFQGTSYDCTDYNRVTSYKLTRDNILSPNVVTLTVTLPELDPGAGMYYYFCIKQPKLTSDSLPSAAMSTSNSSNRSQVLGPSTAAPSSSSSSSLPEELVWVHQGAQWWVTLKVEPPILSVTNDIVLIVFLLFLSAVTSGLNLGLMSLDMNELAVISSCGDHRERSYARTIAPLRKRGNYLLCSLLLGNVMVNSTLTIILEELTSGLIAIIGSTLAIVVLGEIVPQAFCARQGLAIGARTIYLTYAFMILTFPLSWPISCLLDWVLGEEKGNVYDRERLMEFIRITGHHTQLEADEVAIISGALKLKKIKVDQIMTRIEDVFMLPIDCKLDRETIKRIIEKGYSRIPVYEYGDRKQIVALILAKDLALIDPDDHTPIASMLMYCKHPLIFIENDTPLDVALNEFKTGKSHMAVVRQIYDDGEIDKYYEAIGVVTLEDVIEEVLQVEINDETDTLSDNRRKRRRTDAQVAHLIDELTQTSSSAGTGAGTGTGATGAGAGQAAAYSANPIGSKVFQLSGSDTGNGKELYGGANQLTSQLTDISISGLAQSLGRANNNNCCATPTLPAIGSPHELSYSPSVMSQYHSIELSSSPAAPNFIRQPTELANSGGGGGCTGLAARPGDPHHQQPRAEDGNTEAAGGLLNRASQFIHQMMG